MKVEIVAVIECGKNEKVFQPKAFSNKAKNLIKELTSRDTQYVYDCDNYMQTPVYPIGDKNNLIIDPVFVDPYVPTFVSVDDFIKNGVMAGATSHHIICFQPEIIKELDEKGLISRVYILSTGKEPRQNQVVHPLASYLELSHYKAGEEVEINSGATVNQLLRK